MPLARTFFTGLVEACVLIDATGEVLPRRLKLNIEFFGLLEGVEWCTGKVKSCVIVEAWSRLGAGAEPAVALLRPLSENPSTS